MSGTYNALYKYRGALYTKMRQSFIYYETMLSIEENMSKELETMSLWHEYTANGGSADFEVFYAHTIPNQKLLVKVRKGWQKC
jgi:hypothetical protein